MHDLPSRIKPIHMGNICTVRFPTSRVVLIYHEEQGWVVSDDTADYHLAYPLAHDTMLIVAPDEQLWFITAYQQVCLGEEVAISNRCRIVSTC